MPDYTEPVQSTLRAKKGFPLIRTTGNRHYHFTHSQHRNVGALRAQAQEPEAETGPETAKRFGIGDGEMATLETTRGRVVTKVRVDPSVLEGVVCVPHGWSGKATANLLTDAQCRERILGYPDMKSLMCAIRKVEKSVSRPLRLRSHRCRRQAPRRAHRSQSDLRPACGKKESRPPCPRTPR